MDFGLQGKVALVTGSSRGIGWAQAMALAREGAVVAVNGRDAATSEQAAQRIRDEGGRAEAFAADVSREDEVQRLFAEIRRRIGAPDIVINNAGVTGRHVGRRTEKIEAADWDTVMDSHVRSTWLCTKHALADMKSRRWGRIVNTSSIHFTGGGQAGVSGYSAAKAAIAGFSRTVAKEVGGFGITVNTVAPGFVETEMLAGLPAGYEERIRRQCPVGRAATADEIAAAAVFLCSVPAAYITGALLCVDGGRREYAWD